MPLVDYIKSLKDYKYKAWTAFQDDGIFFLETFNDEFFRAFFMGQSVNDGIFNRGLDQQGWDFKMKQVFRDFELHVKSFFKTKTFYRDVRLE